MDEEEVEEEVDEEEDGGEEDATPLVTERIRYLKKLKDLHPITKRNRINDLERTIRILKSEINNVGASMYNGISRKKEPMKLKHDKQELIDKFANNKDIQKEHLGLFEEYKTGVNTNEMEKNIDFLKMIDSDNFLKDNSDIEYEDDPNEWGNVIPKEKKKKIVSVKTVIPQVNPVKVSNKMKGLKELKKELLKQKLVYKKLAQTNATDTNDIESTKDTKDNTEKELLEVVVEEHDKENKFKAIESEDEYEEDTLFEFEENDEKEDNVVEYEEDAFAIFAD